MDCIVHGVAKSWIQLSNFQGDIRKQNRAARNRQLQEYCSGLPCPPLGDLRNPGIEPGSPALHADSLPSEPPGKPSVLSTEIIK